MISIALAALLSQAGICAAGRPCVTPSVRLAPGLTASGSSFVETCGANQRGMIRYYNGTTPDAGWYGCDSITNDWRQIGAPPAPSVYVSEPWAYGMNGWNTCHTTGNITNVQSCNNSWDQVTMTCGSAGFKFQDDAGANYSTCATSAANMNVSRAVWGSSNLALQNPEVYVRYCAPTASGIAHSRFWFGLTGTTNWSQWDESPAYQYCGFRYNPTGAIAAGDGGPLDPEVMFCSGNRTTASCVDAGFVFTESQCVSLRVAVTWGGTIGTSNCTGYVSLNDGLTNINEPMPTWRSIVKTTHVPFETDTATATNFMSGNLTVVNLDAGAAVTWRHRTWGSRAR